MKKNINKVALAIVLVFATFLTYLYMSNQSLQKEARSEEGAFVQEKTALFAGGCFWCVEADFEKLSGISRVESGYAGGKGENPTYENYSVTGHREVVLVTYDPEKTIFEDLVRHLVFHGDPTDGDGSFHDRGKQYAPAIYYETEEEKQAAEKVLTEIDGKKVYDKPLAVEVLLRPKFWPAEEYHQDYAKKNPIRYRLYRLGSGRDAFVNSHLSRAEEQLALSDDSDSKSSQGEDSWQSFQKPSSEQLKKRLTAVQFNVTQREGTERPFENPYHDNKAEGIYVDIVSGEPLFSSKDKYDSGTGWPSFSRPITPESVVEKEDRGLFLKRIEVRSRYGDSHLGHVFEDGPKDRGGRRYCMNSAALRFVPKDQMEAEGYGKWVSLFQ